MPDNIQMIPCLKDNYAFLIRDGKTGEATLIDAPESGPILTALERTGWPLARVLITHHHSDHVDGLAEILAAHPVPVFGNAADRERLPPLDHAFKVGDTLMEGACTVIDAPGHTIGHVAFHFPAEKALFSADSLMTHGCGRLFEGTAEDMFATIGRFAALPDDTRIYSGHDYAAANLSFAAKFAPDADALAARQAELKDLAASGRPTTGITLASEKQINPYLRAHLPEVAEAAGMPGSPALEVFAEIRRRKDAA